MLHPVDECQKPKTAIQGLYFWYHPLDFFMYMYVRIGFNTLHANITTKCEYKVSMCIIN